MRKKPVPPPAAQPDGQLDKVRAEIAALIQTADARAEAMLARLLEREAKAKASGTHEP